jgi:hypothetical protein
VLLSRAAGELNPPLTLSSVLTLTCMNDLIGAKVQKGERILFNVVKDIYISQVR